MKNKIIGLMLLITSIVLIIICYYVYNVNMDWLGFTFLMITSATMLVAIVLLIDNKEKPRTGSVATDKEFFLNILYDELNHEIEDRPFTKQLLKEAIRRIEVLNMSPDRVNRWLAKMEKANRTF